MQRIFVMKQFDRPDVFSRKLQWKKEGKLSIAEFKGFLAVFYNMGLIRKVSIEEYWNTHNPSQSTPWFRCMFSRNRYQNILKFLYLVDKKKIPKVMIRLISHL